MPCSVAPTRAGSAAKLAALTLSALALLPASASALTISLGGTPLVGIKLPPLKTPVTGTIEVPEIGVSVGGGSASEPQLVGVTVGNEPVVQIPAPSLPAPTVPVVSEEASKQPGESTAPGVTNTTDSPSATTTSAGATTSADTGTPAAASTPAGTGSSSGAQPNTAPSTRRHRGRRNAAATDPARAAAGTTATGTSGAPAGGTSSAGPARQASNDSPLDSLGSHIPLPLPVPDWSKPIILLLLLLAVFFAARSRLASRRAKRLEAQRSSLLHDVNVMQGALVPEVPEHLGGLAISVAYRPADGPAAGGDFYDVFCPEPGKVAIVLGDVAGHGYRALKHAALTRYTLRAYLQAGLEPAGALALAGETLADESGELLATVAVGLYETDSSTLTYALAGHPPPLLSGTPAKDPVTICCSPPLGWTLPTGRRQRTISLPAGAQACFFSDGLIEARCAGSPEEPLLGRERLRELLAGLGPEPAAASLLGTIKELADATPDDMAACIVTSEAPDGVEALDVEELEVDQAALTRGSVRELLEACGVPSVEVGACVRKAAAITAECETAMVRIEHGTGNSARAAVRRPDHEHRNPSLTAGLERTHRLAV